MNLERTVRLKDLLTEAKGGGFGYKKRVAGVGNALALQKRRRVAHAERGLSLETPAADVVAVALERIGKPREAGQSLVETLAKKGYARPRGIGHFWAL